MYIVFIEKNKIIKNNILVPEKKNYLEQLKGYINKRNVPEEYSACNKMILKLFEDKTIIKIEDKNKVCRCLRNFDEIGISNELHDSLESYKKKNKKIYFYFVPDYEYRITNKVLAEGTKIKLDDYKIINLDEFVI